MLVTLAESREDRGHRNQLGTMMNKRICVRIDGPCSRYAIVGALAGALLCGSMNASAQAALPSAGPYPMKPVRLIVPFSPGGGADFIGRLLAPKLSEVLGQPVVVENRPGASTIIGGEVAAKAPADGHVLFMATFTNAVNPSLYTKMPWDLMRDLAPVSLLATVSYTLVVHSSLPVKTPGDLVALAKKRPGQLDFASAGNGSPGHLAGELLNTVAQVKIVHVPYKGAAPALTDVIAGQVPITFGNNIATLPHIRSGRLRALGITGAARSPLLPGVPTMMERGLPDFVIVGWYAIMTTAGSPQAATDRLHGELVKILHDPDVQRRLSADGSEPVGSSPAELTAFIQGEIGKWAKVVKSAGLKAD
jgi:tripartite-type tricarboxylate transporter receptor subunit TctC